jgi:hypothetical protein
VIRFTPAGRRRIKSAETSNKDKSKAIIISSRSSNNVTSNNNFHFILSRMEERFVDAELARIVGNACPAGSKKAQGQANLRHLSLFAQT